MKKTMTLLVTSLALVWAVGCTSAQKADQNATDSALTSETAFADLEETTETASSTDTLDSSDAAAAFTAPDSSYDSDDLSLGSGSSGLGH